MTVAPDSYLKYCSQKLTAVTYTLNRDDRYPFSIQELQQMDELFSQLNVSEVQEYGPLLLGWGTLGCLISFLPTKDQITLVYCLFLF
jgi:hypothetical protein